MRSERFLAKRAVLINESISINSEMELAKSEWPVSTNETNYF